MSSHSEEDSSQTSGISQSPWFKSLFELNPKGVALALANGTICDVNPAFCKLGGYIRESLLFRNLYEMFDSLEPGNTGEVPQLLNLSLSGNVEAAFTHEQGHQVPILFSCSPFQSPEGDPYMWVFVEGLEERKQEVARRIQEETLGVVGSLGDSFSQDLNEHLDSLVHRLNQVVLHETGALSPQGQQELHSVIQQSERLRDIVHNVQSRKRQELATQWNVENTLSQVRLRLLREPNSAKLRKYLSSPGGKQELTERLHSAARRSTIDKGLDDVREWLFNSKPPLVMFNDQIVVWKRIQSVIKDAIIELRDLLLQTMEEAQIPPIAMSSMDWPAVDTVEQVEPVQGRARTMTQPPLSRNPTPPLRKRTDSFAHLRRYPGHGDAGNRKPQTSKPKSSNFAHRPVPSRPSSSQMDLEPPRNGFTVKPTPPPIAAPVDTGRHVNVPSSEEIPLPTKMEQLVHEMLSSYDTIKLERWINRKSFEAYLRRHFERHQDEASVPLEPVWDILQKIPGMPPLIVKRYFQQLKTSSIKKMVEWPLFMQESPYSTPPPV